MTEQIRSLPEFQPDLRDLLKKLRATLDSDVHLVGGFVRDSLIGRPSLDLDIVVAGDAAAAADAVAEAFHGHAFPLDDERGQYRVVLPGDQSVLYVDIVTRRGTIEEDLALRDFSVDAMAVALRADGASGALIDPFGGASDASARRLRLVSERAISDDPLRLLRAARLATELGFEVEPATAAAIHEQRARLNEAAAERRCDELCRILETNRAGEGLRLMDRLGLLEVLIPEITAARGVSQPKEHFWDVFDHSLEAVAVLDSLLHEAPTSAWQPWVAPFRDVLGWYPLAEYFRQKTGGQSRRVLTKLAALLHDVSKPETKGPDKNGRIRFLGHADLGAEKARRICSRLRFGRRETAFVALLVEEHLRPTQLSSGAAPTSRAIFRFFRDLGEAAPACLVLSLADAAAAVGPSLTTDRWRGYVAYISYVLERREEQERMLPARHKLSGNTIMAALAIGPGPLVGEIQRAVDEAAATGEVTSDDEALAFARTLYDTWRQEPVGAEMGKA
jgi:poly(A) polymerase